MKKEIPNKKEIPQKEVLFDYNNQYWLKMIRQNSSSAEMISRIRWDFVSKVKPKIVLDFGAGPSWFAAYAPKDVIVDTYDIAPWPQTGIQHNHYDLITMWDVIEHIPDLKVIESFFNSAKAIAIATPILPKNKDFKSWRHNKPGEHLRIFTKESLQQYFRSFGFRLIKSGFPECDCGIRQDIFSALFKKKTVVFANGVFDIVHEGHLELFKKARSFGDRLVVGLDSDESARNLGKKPPRPINSQESRKIVLESIKWIDEIIIFDNLEKVVNDIRPDVIVKGGDYKKDEVVCGGLVEGWGGKIELVSLIEGKSTTAIINKIRDL